MLSRINYGVAAFLTLVPMLIAWATWASAWTCLSGAPCHLAHQTQFFQANLLETCAIVVLFLAAIVVLIVGWLHREGRSGWQGWMFAGLVVVLLANLMWALIPIGFIHNGFELCRDYPRSVGCLNAPGGFRAFLNMGLEFAGMDFLAVVGMFLINKHTSRLLPAEER